MQKQYRLAAVEFVEYGIEGGIARPFVPDTAQEADAIRLQGLKRIFELFQSAFYIGVRNVREKAKALPVVADDLGGKLIRFPGEGAPLFPAFLGLSTRARN